MEDNKSRIKFIVLAMLAYIVLYIILKLLIVYVQDVYMKNDIYDRTYSIGTVININSYTEKEQKDITYFKGKSDLYSIKLKDYFEGFEAGDKDSNYEYHMLYDENNKIQAAFMMGVFETRMHSINNRKEDSFCYEFNNFPLYISEKSRDNFIKKHDIKNDIDLIKYIRERKRVNCNFWTPIIEIKENYFYNFIEASLPDLETITYIEGDLEGYIYEGNDYKQACILKDDKLYCLTFFKLDYFTDDVIKDILRTVIIEK